MVADLRQRLTGLLLDDSTRSQFDSLLYNITRVCFDNPGQNKETRLIVRTSNHFCDFQSPQIVASRSATI